MRAKLATFILGAALIAPATAIGGGWATVGLAPPPDDIRAGTTWVANLEILQHGVTPLEDVEPKVIVSGAGERQVFRARPTGKPGFYRAEVVFPGGGTWSYEVDDGFTQTHTFPPVKVGGEPATPAPPKAAGSASGDDGGPALALALGGVAAGLAGALALAVLRRRPHPS
jgi:hypothetical protein